MRRTFALILCLSTTALAAELEPVVGPLDVGGAPPPGRGEFRVLMPPGAEAEGLQLQIPGGLVHVSAWGTADEGRFYSVTASDYPPSALQKKNQETILREVVTSMVRQLEATDAFERPIRLGRNRGLAVKARCGLGPINARFYFASGRLFGLLVIGEPNATSKKFLKGLKLLGPQRSQGEDLLAEGEPPRRARALPNRF